MSDLALTHENTEQTAVRLHYVCAGRGPLVVMLHGFPDFWFTWRHQLAPLVEAGYRVVAPDMRGHNISEKPRGVAAYGIEVLARDVVELISECGEERAIIVGHDWGAAVAWQLAMHHAEAVEKLVILNLPHPGLLGRMARSLQVFRSWYMFFFQLPWLPEIVLSAFNFLALRWGLRRGTVRHDAFTPDELKAYVKAMGQEGALTCMINYYRAYFRRLVTGRRPATRVIEAPTLVIWGARDRFLSHRFARPDRGLVPHCRVNKLWNAGHFVHLERPEEVNEILLGFLGS